MVLDGLGSHTGTLDRHPVRADLEIDRALAARAMIAAPLAVVPLAAGGMAVASVASAAGMPGLVVGLLVVGTLPWAAGVCASTAWPTRWTGCLGLDGAGP